MNYTEKKAAVKSVSSKLEEGFGNVPGLRYDDERLDRKGYSTISLLDDGTFRYHKEARIDIFVDAQGTICYRMTSYPGSDIPFDPEVGKVDYNDNGEVEVSDIISIAARLFMNINN